MLHSISIRYQPPTAGDHKVEVAGDFTDWQIVLLDFNNGIYQKQFSLQTGIYQYKLIIDGVWQHDPSSGQTTPDPFGGLNTVLIVDIDSSEASLNELIYDEQPVFNEIPGFDTPDWVAEGIIYQIFPDRFCNGKPELNPDFSEWYYDDCKTPPVKGKHLRANHEYFHLVKDWYDIKGLKQSPYLAKGKPDWWSFYGGDIAGVRQKLDYLLDLGITIIYFNPLWQAKSNHKYDAADFRKIDPHFASEEEFREFTDLCHAKGIRIILDIALNHTGETFWAFRDCVESGDKSEHWNWYDWKQWPLPSPLPENFKPKDYYQCWWGVKDMPDLNYDLSREHPYENALKDIRDAEPNWNMINHILEAVSWWLTDMDIDGFRLDVPDEVPYWFWQLFRDKVKSLKPDAWLVGELWQHAEQWVSPKYFDSVMNYAGFKDPVLDYFINETINKDTFLQRIYISLKTYPFNSLHVMMNLLGSHDTWRIGEIAQDKLIEMKLAILFQMTYIGAPHIYYGDEIAMKGGKDPDNRRPFDWHWYNSLKAVELHDYYKVLIALRKTNRVFHKGLIRFHYHPELLIFERFDQNDSILVIINKSGLEVEYPTQDTGCDIIFMTPDTITTIESGTLIVPSWSAILIKSDK